MPPKRGKENFSGMPALTILIIIVIIDASVLEEPLVIVILIYHDLKCD